MSAYYVTIQIKRYCQCTEIPRIIGEFLAAIKWAPFLFLPVCLLHLLTLLFPVIARDLTLSVFVGTIHAPFALTEHCGDICFSPQ